MFEKKAVISGKTGLHARPASVFVQTAMKYKSAISVETAAKKVDAKSLISVLTLGAAKGTEVLIKAEGPDEEEAVLALLELLAGQPGAGS